MKPTFFAILLMLAISTRAADGPNDGRAPRTFDPAKDLLSLHYDHAPDRDDGHSAAADRTLLETVRGRAWITNHVVAVSGAYGRNARTFNPKSDAVMDAAWSDAGGWVAAHTNREAAVAAMTGRWERILNAGGDVWVKEGGQSDLTAAVVKELRRRLPDLESGSRIHVVQHSNWNENETTPEALEYTRKHTHYVRICDANAYLNQKGGDAGFEKAATAHPVFGPAWKAAFAYYPPRERLDFSDTGELLHILGLGELNLDDFRRRFLEGGTAAPPGAGPGK